jgi:SAM-dependent methyltransferase
VSATALEQLLRCPLCGQAIEVGAASATCGAHTFPVEQGIARLLPPDLMRVREGHRERGVRARTYESFGFEWQRFSQLRPDYQQNFDWYREPLGDVSLAGRRVLDAGCGMGRHTHHFLAAGASVVAVDASPAVDVAARNNPNAPALFVQADILHLPVQAEAFDVVSCLGVLHHIEDTRGALARLVGAARAGGWILVYLYHDPSETSRWRGILLSLVTLARRVTTRMPMEPLRVLTWILAAALFLTYILPARLLGLLPGLGARLRRLPLGQYLDYPFGVLWNDQFDRFSAPLEKRYRKAEVEALLQAAGLEAIRILGGYGWRAAGRRPA